MRTFVSISPRRRHTDPTPYVADKGQVYEHRIGEAECFRFLMHNAAASIAYAYDPRPEFVPTTTNPVNPILEAYRETHDGSASSTHEALLQLARHWSLWQSARMGTFPVDYSDPAGPVDRAYSEESGEDMLYWSIDDAIRAYLVAQGVEILETDSEPNGWGPVARLSLYERTSEVVQDMIAHAVSVLDRLDRLYMARGDL